MVTCTFDSRGVYERRHYSAHIATQLSHIDALDG
jgi:hypothetical protein